MDIETRCLPVGALPYSNVKHVTTMISKLYRKMPYIVSLPHITSTDTVTNWLFENIPGIICEKDKIKLQAGISQYEDNITSLDKAFNGQNPKELDKFEFKAEFFEKYLQIIKKFHSPNACINLLGPFTTSQILMSSAKDQMLADKSYKKIFIEAVCVKAFWAINQIKSACSDTVPIVILEEPMLGQLGNLKRESSDVTADLVINLLGKVIEKIKTTGAIVGVQCFEKCDWTVPIRAGVDLISFDAYNNPNNLSIIPEILTKYLRKGGIVNWGIVPTVSDNIIKSLNLDYLYKRLCSTIEGTMLSGVPAELLYKNAMVSLNGDADHLSVIFAEKANILATQLGAKLALGF